MLDKTDDKIAEAMKQGQAQFDSIKEMVDELQACEGDEDGRDHDVRREAAEQAIQEDALSVEVRSGWYTPGGTSGAEQERPEEYTILLCTGGPACRIIGELDGYGQPETARLEVQDWFTPWTLCRPIVGKRVHGAYGVEVDDYDSEPTLLAYARCFWFGE